MNSNVKNSIYGICFVLILLLLVEILFRNILVFPLTSLKTYAVYDDVIFYHKPNSTGFQRSEVGEYNDVVIKYNQFGFRGTWNELPKNKEINILLSDSIIESRQTQYEQTATELLNKNFQDKFFINTGCSQYTTTTEYLLLKYRLLKLKPKNIYLFFSANDYADNHGQYGGYYTQPSIFETYPEKRFQPLIFKSVFSDIKQHLKANSALFSYVLKWSGLDVVIAKPQPLSKEKLKFYIPFAGINKKTEEMDALEKEILNFTHLGLLKIKELASLNGINFKVFIVPTPPQINKDEWKTGKVYLYSGGEEYFEPSHIYQERLIEFCKKSKIECIDLYPYFKAASDKGKLYLSFDGHWSNFGQEVVANAVIKNIF